MILQVFQSEFFSEKNRQIGVIFVIVKISLQHMKTLKILVLILPVIAFTRCGKIEQLPPEPYIEFSRFTVYDTIDILGNRQKAGKLEFEFEDGDGDLGLEPPNNLEEADSTNLFFTMFRKTGGVMEQVTENDPLKPSSYRIPFMDRPGQNKILKGNMIITFLYMTYNVTDTIKYEFYVRDRAGNESNTDETSEIVLSVNKVYGFEKLRVEK